MRCPAQPVEDRGGEEQRVAEPARQIQPAHRETDHPGKCPRRRVATEHRLVEHRERGQRERQREQGDGTEQEEDGAAIQHAVGFSTADARR
jgi:hypothetical protein